MNNKSTPTNLTVANSYIASLLSYSESVITGDIYAQLDFLKKEAIFSADANARFNAFAYNQTIAIIAEKFSRPTLGLDFGGQIGAKAFNLLGYLTMSASTLGEAASALQRYNKLVSNMGQSVITLESTLGYAEWQTKPEVKRFSYHVVDAVLAGWCAFSRFIVGENLPLVAVELNHNNIEHRKAYENFYGCDVTFSSPRNRLVFKKSWFELPVTQSEKNVYKAIVAQADIALSKIEEGGFPKKEQIIHVIAECLPSGDFGVAAIAKKFIISERTFQRKLSLQNMTFRDLQEKAREQLALTLLNNSELSLADIAGLLGFSEQSAFTRAFKRWTGKTPNQLRTSQSS